MSRMPKCRKCKGSKFRRKGLEPTNKQASGKGWRGEGAKGYHQACVNRLFKKVYVCKRCNTKINYGNAGRPIT